MGRRGRDGQLGREDAWQGGSWRTRRVRGRLVDWSGISGRWQTGQSHICMWINWEEYLGSKTDHVTQSSSVGKIPVWGNTVKTSDCKTCKGCGGRRNSQPHRRVHWRDPQGPRMYTKPPTRESALKGPNLLVGSGGSD